MRKEEIQVLPIHKRPWPTHFENPIRQAAKITFILLLAFLLLGGCSGRSTSSSTDTAVTPRTRLPFYSK
ncbi:MAG: hypothetical protein HC804_00235 [Anaerolineae bacterium]|nr:hypothetical protein [Anaerolineae bacterium]